MNNQKREIAVAVVGCAAAAGVALFAGSRTWLVETVIRPSPLGPVSIARTGASLVPALAAATLVVLAGAGALLATRGWGRRAVGLLIVAGGLGLSGLALSQLGREGIATSWALVTVAAGLIAAVAGGFAVVRGATVWPSLGRRYDRTTSSRRYGRTSPDRGYVKPTARRHEAETGDRTSESGQRPSGEAASRDFWDALDRGEDPTKT